MSTVFPTSLDAYSNPNPTDDVSVVVHSTQHANHNDAIEALEAKVGIDSSAVATSLDYLVKSTSSSNPGHKHTLANGATDVTASVTELNYVGGVTSAIQTQLDAKVNDTGDETIAGVKTFSSDPIIPDEAYGVGWNGVLEPPTKNALYDKIETLSGLAWNASINGATGTGVALALDNSYAASGIGLSVTMGNTQTQNLTGIKVDTGTAVTLAPIGLDVQYRKSTTSGAAINVNMGTSGNYGTGLLIDITGDNNTAQRLIKMTPDGNFTGYGLEFNYDGSSASSGLSGGNAIYVYSDHQRSNVGNKTTNVIDVYHNRGDTRTSGTTADNYKVMSLVRGSRAGGVGGAMTAAGNVLFLQNDDTAGSGTLTDTVDVLQITQDSLSTGNPISITQAATVSTNYRKLIKETSTGITLWMGNGTTANGVLSGTAGDVLLNGGGNKTEYCTGTTNWTVIGQKIYEAVVAASGGDYTTLGAAITAGATRIFVRNGTYSESAISSATNSIMIIGESPNGAIIDMGANNFTLSGTNVTVENLKFSTAAGIVSFTGAYARILNCELTTTGTTNTYFDVTGDDSLIEGCNVIDAAASSTATPRVNLSGLRTKISNNLFKVRHAGGIGVKIGNAGSAVSQSVTGNTFQKHTTSSGNHLVNLNGYDSSFTGNTFYVFNNSDRALLVDGANCSIIGNTFTGGIRSIMIDNSHNTIVGNNFDNTGGGRTAIYLQNTNCTISGNYFRSQDNSTSTNIGIEIADGNGSHVISGNNFVNQYDAIKILGSSTNNVQIYTNSFITTGNLAISDLGPTTSIFGNLGTDATINDKRFVPMKNTSGGALAVGDVVVFKSVAAGNEVTTTTTAGDDKVYGIAAATIADTATGLIQITGKTTALKVDGTTDIAIGDFITTFTTAKIGAKAAAGDMVFAIALEAYTANDSNGVIDAILISPHLI